jgi:putative Holliday junction resolvase
LFGYPPLDATRAITVAAAAPRPLTCPVPIVAIAELEACLTARRRLLGLDVGSKTIGLALSDSLGIVATPHDTIRRTKFAHDAQALAALIGAREVGGLVIGLPINMDGSEGPRCQSVRQFAANLLAVIERPMAFWDERLSTAAVTRLMVDADLSRQRRAALVDKMAAAYILQGALDHLRSQRNRAG